MGGLVLVLVVGMAGAAGQGGGCRGRANAMHRSPAHEPGVRGGLVTCWQGVGLALLCCRSCAVLLSLGDSLALPMSEC